MTLGQEIEHLQALRRKHGGNYCVGDGRNELWRFVVFFADELKNV